MLAEEWKLTPRMALEVGSHEAILRMTYVDSVGVNTWSVGLTAATGHNVDRYIDNPAPMQQCINVYVWALNNYADHVRNVFRGHEMTEAEFTAALSFVWNLGPGNLQRASWVKQWKGKNFAAAKKSFMAWNKPPEIIGRRKRERDLFFDGVWHNNGTITEFTRVTKRRTPDWTSGVKRDISKEVEAAMNMLHGQTVAYVDEGKQPDFKSEPAAPTMSEVAVPRPKPMWKSTTNWGAIGGFVTSVFGALQSLDPFVAVPLIVVAAGVTIWIIRERKLKAAEFGV